MAIQFPSDAAGNTPYTDPSTGYIYDWDGQKWNGRVESGAGGTPIDVGETPPDAPTIGDLWWNSEDGRLYIYYNDGNTQQWVDASPPGSGGGGSDYVLPTATASVLGGVKVGARLTITDGVLSADNQGGGGSSVGSLQEVTDVGNTSDKDIQLTGTAKLTARSAELGTVDNGGGLFIHTNKDGGGRFRLSNETDGTVFTISDSGTTVVGAGGYGTADDGTTILPGYLRLTGTSGSPLNIYKTNNPNAVISLGVDGSGTFEGSVTAGNTLLNGFGFGINVSDGTNNQLQYKAGIGLSIGYVDGGSNDLSLGAQIQLNESGRAAFAGNDIILNVDGSATFSGLVETGGVAAGDLANGPYAYVTTSGSIDLWPAGAQVFYGKNTDGSSTSNIYSDGSADFAGPIAVGTVSGSTPFAQIAAGSIQARPDTWSDLTFVGYAETGATPVFSVNGQGSASFASSVQVGTTGADTTNPGGFVYSTRWIDNDNRGSAALNGASLDGGLASLLVIDRSDGGGETVVIKPDGSANFAGVVDSIQFIADQTGGGFVASRLSDGQEVFRAGSTNFNIADTNTYTSAIYSDGSANFAGPVKSESPSGTWSALNPGYIVIQQPGTSSNDLVFRARNSVGSEVVEFFGDGSASFANNVISDQANTSGYFFKGIAANNTLFEVQSDGQLALRKTDGTASIVLTGADGTSSFAGIQTIGTIDIAQDGVGGVEVRNDGLVRAQRPSNKTGSAVFQGWCGTDLVSPTSQIQADGSATFAGNVIVGGNPTDGLNVGIRIADYGAILAARSASDSVFNGYNSDNPNSVATSSIFANGNADFAGAVTAATVNGVNVANVGAALTSLKTSAATATDLDELKAAIASALTNF